MLGDASEECSAAPLDRWLALSREARELTCVAAPRRCAAADAERALSEAVRARAPLLIEGGCADWPAVQRWRCDEYLAEACGEAAVTVDWTPDGRADSVMRARDADSEGKPREEGAERRGGELPLFVQPLQRRSTMASFLEQLRATRGEKAGDEAPANEGAERRMNVPYLSAQCGNLDSELGALAADVVEPPWARVALGNGAPEARNVWIGDARSVTSVHRDHYENLYCVLTGEKRIFLLPPTDYHRLQYCTAAAARWEMTEGGEAGGEVASAALRPALEEPRREVRWAEADPTEPHLWPRLGMAVSDGGAHPPLEVRVRAGDALYLPAEWFHAVRQREDDHTGRVTAVNFWYDMTYGIAQAQQRTIDDAWDEHERKLRQQQRPAAGAFPPVSTPLRFGQYTLAPTQVFDATPMSFCFVNLKPVVPGHVLVAPRRVVKRFADLSAEEVTDLWVAAQRCGQLVERIHGAEALTLAIQDGAAAGQTVSHVHIHVMPRKKGDFEPNDMVYDAMDEGEKEFSKALDSDRKPRTEAEMEAEARLLWREIGARSDL